MQFRLLAKIIGRICHSENWGFLYLTGECSLDHRSKVIKMFREDSEVKVLIAGLKCGGLGLNFPWANRCVSLDLWVCILSSSSSFRLSPALNPCTVSHSLVHVPLPLSSHTQQMHY